MIVFDTSALAKLVVEERESAALEDAIRSELGGSPRAISTIAVTELRRLGIRVGADVAAVQAVVNLFQVLTLTEGVLQLAGRLPYRHLGTLDAIHVSTALAVGATAVVTYDLRMIEAAQGEGLTVLSPGR